MNIEPDDLATLKSEDGIAFGRFEIAAPARIDSDLGAPGTPLATPDGAVVDLVRDGSSCVAFRFRVPPDGSFRWALPSGTYEIVRWRGLLRDSPAEKAEAILDLRVRFEVAPSAAAAIGAVRFDGSALSVVEPAPDEIARFRAALPGFRGEAVPRRADALSVSPPVRTVRFMKPGGNGDSCRTASGGPLRA